MHPAPEAGDWSVDRGALELLFAVGVGVSVMLIADGFVRSWCYYTLRFGLKSLSRPSSIVRVGPIGFWLPLIHMRTYLILGIVYLYK